MTSPKSKTPIHPFQATVSNLSNRNVLSEVNLRLTPAQLAKFKKTCFGKLLDITLKFQGALVHCMLLREVAKSDVQPFEMWFDLLGHAIRFSYHEFGLVSGLRFAPIPCESSYHFKEVEEVHVKDKAGEIIVKRKEVEKHRLRDLYFKGRERIKLREYKEKFNELDFYSIDDDDAVKLALILVLELFLCGRDKRRLIHPFHMQLVDDLDQFNAYPWGTFCWAWTYKSLHDALSGRLNKYADRSAKKNNDCKYNLAGCPFIFQAWVYEAIPYCNGLYGVKKSLPSIPRIVTWNTSKTIEYRDVQLRLFAADNVDPLVELRASDSELEEDWFKLLQLYKPSELDIALACYGEDDIDKERLILDLQKKTLLMMYLLINPEPTQLMLVMAMFVRMIMAMLCWTMFLVLL